METLIRCFLPASAIAMILVSSAYALSPAPPAPCTKNFNTESISRLAKQIKVRDKNYQPDTWTAQCAGKALSARGEAAVPPLLILIQDADIDTSTIAMESLCPIGKQAAAAIPILVTKLNVGNPTAGAAYAALACMGTAAVPIIPLLMKIAAARSSVNEHGDESWSAIYALGGLGKYDPETVTPFLVKLLGRPTHAKVAALALEAMGRSARESTAALRVQLTAAMSLNDWQLSKIFIKALASVGAPKVVVPIMISLLQNPDLSFSAAYALATIGPPATDAIPALIQQIQTADVTAMAKDMEVGALISIDPTAPAVLATLLPIATAKYSTAGFSAARALAKVNPLPADFAPDLRAAMNRADTDPIMKAFFQQGLANTHTSSPPLNPSKSP